MADVKLQNSIQVKARRLLAAAARGLNPITAVGSGMTLTAGTSAANSTVQTSATIAFGQGVYQPNDLTVFEHIGGKFVLSAGNNSYVGGAMTGNNGTLTKRGTHGHGLRFATDAPDVDINIVSGNSVNATLNGGSIIAYVTDMATGIRSRAVANDLVHPDSNYRYDKLSFGSAGNRIVELYFTQTCALRGMNVATGYSIWRAPRADEPRILGLGDSYWNGQGSLNTNECKLTMSDFLGEVLGAPNIICSANGGTGLLNPGGTNGTYAQRVANGDLDIANVGDLDLIYLWNSVNDNLAVNAAYTDAAAAAALSGLLASIMTIQPNAIIMGCGPQVTAGANGAAVQTRYDALKAAFQSTAGTDPRCIWLDNSPSGQNWMYGSSSTGNVQRIIGLSGGGGDNTHLNNVGMPYLGKRLGYATIDALGALI